MRTPGYKDTGQDKPANSAPARLIVLDPGHFHAALLQKTNNTEVDPIVYVFAPEGSDVKIASRFNRRIQSPE